MAEKPNSPNFNIVTYTSPNKNTDNLADALTQTTGAVDTIAVDGFYEKDDVEYGVMQYFETSTLKHDGGIVIDPNAPSPSLDLNAYLSYVSTTPGRWIRKYGDRVPIEWFGAKKNNEEFDNILPISKALASPHLVGKELFFSKGYYVIKSTLIISTGNITIAGSGKYDTFIVGYKFPTVGSALAPHIYIYSGSDNVIIKDIGLKPWNYPSRHEPGWTDRFKFTGEGRIMFADGVAKVNRGINGGDPDFFELDLTDSATQQLFPPHWYRFAPSTKAMLQCGGLITSDINKFKTYYRTIQIAPGQTADIVDTFTATGLPPNFNLDTWNFSVRIIHTGTVQKGGSTIPSSNNAAMLPAGYGTPAVGVSIQAEVAYNYNGTFTITFKFRSPVSTDFSGLASSNISGSNYVMPYALDLIRAITNLEINNVFIDGLRYAGPVNFDTTATNIIGTDDMLTFYSIKNVRILNCNIENYSNDGISMKDVFDSWGPSIQTRSINNGVVVKNTQFRRGGKSGVDTEGSDITFEDCKFLDIMNLGALRYGSRSYGVIQEKYLFKNCECSVDPKGESPAAASIQRFLGLSRAKKAIYDSCTFFVPPYLTSAPPVIGVYAATNATKILIVENCTFDRIYKAVQITNDIHAVVISDCHNINTGYDNGCIFYSSGGAVLKGQIDIRNHYFERNDNYASKLLDGSITGDKNQLIKCSVTLSETDTLPLCAISYNIFRTVFNNFNSMTKNIIEHVTINDPWAIGFALGSGLSNFVVDTTSQQYKYVGKNIVVYLKLTGDVATTSNTSFTFTLPVPVSSGSTNIYGTCTSNSAGSAQGVGAVIYNSANFGRVRIAPTGTGSTTFWIMCEYEF